MPYDKVLQEDIEFTKYEEKIVNLEKFQRLKFIKQNGLAYVLYPDARNNRFDHSVGTMYWATHLFKSIYPSSNEDSLQSVRLAALIHDIGHGPFSHVMEMLFNRNLNLKDFEPWKELRRKFGNKKPHELLTLDFVDSKTFRDHVPSTIRDKVDEILRGKSPLSLLISGDLDADRLDYLLRDSYHSGLPFGLNVKPIFNQLLQHNIQIIQKESGYFLQLDSSALPAFEQLLMARYAHYHYIAYEPSILSANLVLVTELEKNLLERIKDPNKIARAVFYIYTELDDDKLLDLDFSGIEEEKRKLLAMIKTKSISRTFKNLKNLKSSFTPNFIKLSYLGKKITYNFFKEEIAQIKELEAKVTKELDQPVKIHLCIPEALTTRTRVFDEGINEGYRPSLIYDYSPFVRSLEQKMYLDCGIVLSVSISRERLVKIFYEKINGDKTDFDVYANAIYEYIKRIQEVLPKEKQRWELRRTVIFEFLRSLNEDFSKKGKIKNKIDFEAPWYCVEVYELLQKLEFLDFLDEDFNLAEGDGSIPCYIYSIGEYGEEISNFLKLTDKEKKDIAAFVSAFVKKRTLRKMP